MRGEGGGDEVEFFMPAEAGAPMEGGFDLIAHGCNCFCSMGAGIAKGVRTAVPEAYELDLVTSKGARAKLRTCSAAEAIGDKWIFVVVNAYTQYDYRGRGNKEEYEAVRSCMRWIRENYSGRRIGLPKTGAGLARGNWEWIAKIILEELAGEDATIVEFKQTD